jgi:hypothetical protein
VAVHELVLTVGARLGAAFAEGRGDAVLERRWPTVAHALPEGQPTGRPMGAALAAALPRPTTRRLVIAVLDALERLRLRALWWRVFQAAQGREYARGRRADGTLAGTQPDPLSVDLQSDDLLPRPRLCAPPLQVRSGEKEIEIRPEGGRWNAKVAVALAEASRSGKSRWRSAPAPPRPDGLVTVAVGPGHRGRDRERLLALEAFGVQVRVGDGPRGAHWAVLDRLVRESPTEVVATVIPGTLVEPGWIDEVAATIDGDRVVLALGAPMLDADETDDLWMMSRFDALERYPVLSRPFGYVAIRRTHYLSLGGIDPSTTAFGPYAPLLELAERALDRGLIVASRNLADVRRDRQSRVPVLRHEWQRQRARGALLARGDGARLAVARGAAPLVALLVRHGWPTPKAVGPLVAYACGVGEGVAAGSTITAPSGRRRRRAAAATGSTPRSAPRAAGSPRTRQDGARR